MYVKVVKSYYDKEKHRNIGKGETIQVSDSRFQELKKAGIAEKIPDKTTANPSKQDA